MTPVNEFIEIKEVAPEDQVTEWLNQLVAVREQIAAVTGYYDAAIAILQDARTKAIGTELPALH